jgi:hypothetical protein
MLPEKAKEKWCPFRSRFANNNCLIDNCMAWKEYLSVQNKKGEFEENKNKEGLCKLIGK